jgi:hypothetical protein
MLLYRGDQGLYYLEEYVPEETSVLAMVAQKMTKLSYTELVHIQLCHLCPTLVRHFIGGQARVNQCKPV